MCTFFFQKVGEANTIEKKKDHIKKMEIAERHSLFFFFFAHVQRGEGSPTHGGAVAEATTHGVFHNRPRGWVRTRKRASRTKPNRTT
jgi:hypothetical protein